MGRARVGQGEHRGGGVRSGLRARPASGPLPPLHPSLCAVRTQGPPSPPQPLCLGLRHHLPGSPSSLCLLSPRLCHPPSAPSSSAQGSHHRPQPFLPLSEATSLSPALLGPGSFFAMQSAEIPYPSSTYPFLCAPAIQYSFHLHAAIFPCI